MTSCVETKYVTKYELIKPPQTLLTKCRDVTIEYSTNGELLMSLIDLNSAYMECKSKVSSIIDYYNFSTFIYNGNEE